MTQIARSVAEATPATPRGGHPRRWSIVGVLILAESLELIDGTIVNVAAPTIQQELGASSAALQWIAGGYALAIAAGLLPGARLGDIYGRRRLLLLGTVGFTVASLLCGLAPSTGALIGGRLAQGLAAALVLPQIVGIVHAAFSTDELPKAFGVFGPALGLAAAVGPILGGALVGADLFGTGWRLIFFVNLPLGVLAVWSGLRVLPESRTPGAPTLDVGGALLAALAMGLLVYPLIEGREVGWPPWTFAMMGASALLFVLFGWLSLRGERAGGHPLVTPSILRKRPFTAGVITLLLFVPGAAGVNLALTLYLQLGLGFSAIHSGTTFAPWPLGAAAGGLLSGLVLTARLGRRAVHAGLLLAFVGAALLLVVVHGQGQRLTALALAGPMLVYGFGSGLIGAPLIAILLAVVDDREVGSASGVLNALYQLGAAVGVALLGTIFFAGVAASGYTLALEHVLWAELGLLVAVSALVFVLPRTVSASGRIP